MRVETFASPVVANLLVAAALTWTPVWAHPGTYFGVRVSSEYRRSPEARRSGRKFTLRVWAATLLAVALSVAAAALESQWLVALGVLVQLAAATFAFRGGWRETTPRGIAPPSTRTAHLFSRPPRPPGGAPAMLAPFLLLAAVALYLLSNWEAIPLRFPIHWGAQGQANGWSDRTVLGVFGPLLIALVVLVFLSGVVALITRSARPAQASSGLDRRNRAMLAIPVVVMWVVATAFSLAALTPLILRNGQFPIPAFVLFLVPVAALAAVIWYAARAGAAPAGLPDDHTPDDCWRWGQFYYNPDDPSIMVERRFGIGYTFNFAHWQSWLAVAGVLAVPAAIAVFARHIGAR